MNQEIKNYWNVKTTSRPQKDELHKADTQPSQPQSLEAKGSHLFRKHLLTCISFKWYVNPSQDRHFAIQQASLVNKSTT